MKLTKKIIGTVLSLSILIVPNLAEAKSKNQTPKKTNVVSQKTSKKSNYKKVSSKKKKVVKVSYNYGPRVYADGIEPNKEIYKYAIGLLGTKYSFGGTTINGIDCSSFVQQVFELAGFKMPRTAREQARYGYFVRKEDLKPGDLLFFATYASFPSHVGIYIGDGKMIHASSKGGRVEITDINQTYYQKRFLFAKRIPPNTKDLEEERYIENMQEYLDELQVKKEKKTEEEDPIVMLLKDKHEEN